jgi:polyribonucleotide nucleotidyltransferase
MIMNKKVECNWGGRTISIETGKIAKQTNGAVTVQYGDSIVLVTAVASKEPRDKVSFFPLTVDYQEMTYAAGKIPGGFFKREGRPNEREILTSRFIDRPLRPLFPDGFTHDVQIIATVLSADPENNPDILAIIGASAALEISNIPFKGPIAGVRVGRISDQFVINPSHEQLKESTLEIIIAGSKDAVVMVEGEATMQPEAVISDAISFGHQSIMDIIDMQLELKSSVGKQKMEFASLSIDENLKQDVVDIAAEKIAQAIRIPQKLERYETLRQIEKSTIEALLPKYEDCELEIGTVFDDLQKKTIRDLISKEKIRIGGRSFDQIREISSEVSVLPRTHGSALFTRGETQVLASTTLGTTADEQRIDSVMQNGSKAFMLHYNFPPFSVGEVKFLRSPSRREIGHGTLAEKAISKILPRNDEFPYTIRIVSDVLESNGSSSMATVCGSVLSLMDAGVPIKAPVAGIALGLIKEGDDFIVLSDILGDEDHIGDMDFKVAGTREGVTALQMDIKITGITPEILNKALAQAREGRLFILDKMATTIKEPRSSLSTWAPRIATIQLKTDKIGDVIGPGGKIIKNIIEQTGAKIEIDETGKVNIYSSSSESVQKAIDMIQNITQEAEINKIYRGTVKRIMDFGAFVEIFPGTDGLVHISQLAEGRVKNVRDVLKEGDEVMVKVLEIDKQGKIKLSRKEALNHPQSNGQR